jgi:tRNA uridine 5-carbamoylmethylation protein Kti12
MDSRASNDNRPAVLILTGPPGAGKTTVSGLLAEGYQRSVHLESDCLFEFIRAGYIEPWKADAHPQNQVVMRIVADAAAAYATAGYMTIVDGIVIPGWFYESVRDALVSRRIEVSFVVLRPPLRLCTERSRHRKGGSVIELSVVRQLWSSFSDLGSLESHVIDNANQEPEATAEAVAHLLGEHRLLV